MNVTWSATGVRPETCIDLLGFEEFVYDAGRTLEQRPEFARLAVGELGYPSYVPLGLHEQCPDSERADAVFNPPVGYFVNEPAREGEPPFR